MNIYAIADLHLPGIHGKAMDVFGDHWRDHPSQIAANWDRRVNDDDLVLLPGDISWAMRLAEAEPDLKWIGERPGVKVMIRGNHDFWWNSIGKVRSALPARCHAIQNDAWISDDGKLGVAGARMWDVPGISFGNIFGPPPDTDVPSRTRPVDPERQNKIFQRELARLQLSLQQIPDRVEYRITMVHYPPTDLTLSDTVVTELLERYGVDLCIYGHLHNVRERLGFSAVKNGVHYELTSADFLDFNLLELGGWDHAGTVT